MLPNSQKFNKFCQIGKEKKKMQVERENLAQGENARR
jgi:hypothetical protein